MDGTSGRRDVAGVESTGRVWFARGRRRSGSWRLAWLVVLPLALAALLPGLSRGSSGDIAICPTAGPGQVRCLAHALPWTGSTPTGYTPAQIKAAYGFPTRRTAGAGETIAIVDAHDSPTIESDLAVFDTQFGLPACTTANGCFTKVDASGGTNYPSTQKTDWAFEISIDVEWAHAIAPGAKILLVEAHSAGLSDMLSAEDYAKANAQYVSNSWATGEFGSESKDDSHFVQPGTSIFAASGDSGTPPVYPSASPNVISVGGTTLTLDSSGNVLSETAWSSGGGGCSKSETANPVQASFGGYAQVGCKGNRATPDVAAVADPATGVSVYDSTPAWGLSGWWTAGGTSLSSPIVAARAADAGIVVDAAAIYGSSITYRDITVGNNGAPCLVGYDLCSGRGSWIGATP